MTGELQIMIAAPSGIGTGSTAKERQSFIKAWSSTAGSGTDLVHVAALAADEVLFRARGDQLQVDRKDDF